MKTEEGGIKFAYLMKTDQSVPSTIDIILQSLSASVEQEKSLSFVKFWTKKRFPNSYNIKKSCIKKNILSAVFE